MTPTNEYAKAARLRKVNALTWSRPSASIRSIPRT